MARFRQALVYGGVLSLAFGLLAVAEALAQHGSSARPALQAGRLQGEFRLDGLLDEPAWGRSESITGLTQIEPTEGGEPSGRTVVKVLADSRQLVFGILAFDPDPSAIVAFATRRDASLRNEDHIRIRARPLPGRPLWSRLHGQPQRFSLRRSGQQSRRRRELGLGPDLGCQGGA